MWVNMRMCCCHVRTSASSVSRRINCTRARHSQSQRIDSDLLRARGHDAAHVGCGHDTHRSKPQPWCVATHEKEVREGHGSVSGAA
eukprot:1720025-Rhodomonas_salina.4